jgi:hypothetical protein
MIRRLSRTPCLLALLLLAGCRADEGITEYQVPRENQPQSLRLLVAIVPDANQNNWFFKLLGPTDAVTQHQKKFESFVQSIRVKDNKPDWKLPEGWSETDNPARGMRYKTLRITPPGEAALDVAVSEARGDLLANVNRWRRQDLGLPEFPTEAALREARPVVIQEIPLPDQKLILVDMTGTKPRRGPQGMPPMGPAGNPAPPAAGLTFNVPEDWRKVTPPRSAIPIDYAFSISKESATPEVTLIQMPTLDKSQWAGNIDRWRKQVGLPPLQELPKNEPTLSVAGKESPYLDFTGEGKDPKRLLVVVYEKGPITWYIKMLAPAETVAKQKAAFENFAKSIRFDAAPGARP